MVERADQGEVLELRSTAVVPPPDVVRLGESSHPTAREATLAIAIRHLAEHPRGRLSPGALPTRSRCPDGLPARSAFWRCRVLDAPRPDGAPDRPRPRSHRCPLPGPWPVRGSPPLPGPGRHRPRCAPSTSRRARRPAARPRRSCRPRPAWPGWFGRRARALGPRRRLRRQAARPPVRSGVPRRSTTSPQTAREPARPHHPSWPPLRGRPCGGSPHTRRAEPTRSTALRIPAWRTASLDQLVDAERAARESLREPGEVFQREGGGDPTARLPVRERVADREEVRGIARALLAHASEPTRRTIEDKSSRCAAPTLACATSTAPISVESNIRSYRSPFDGPVCEVGHVR
jgi:hypothetical protein